MRKATVQRVTFETDIQLTINLDGTGKTKLNTGLPFLDHMLSHVAVHGLFDLEIRAEGDLEIDEHHTLEDVALALGQAFDQALGERKGINRMGSALVPMDETLARVALDLSGRPYCVFDSEWNGPSVGGIAASLFRHFFESFAYTARCNLHARVLYGADDHHRAEALFKALGRALDQAARIDPRREQKIPSTKGII
jgi:imidazoleglycerol-phosphate dehydratase